MARFERLWAWQEARKLVGLVYRMTEMSGFAGRSALVNQIRRAAESVTSNIAEGYARTSPGDTKRLWSFALGSLSEVQSQLFNALDTGCVNSESFRAVYDQAETVDRLTRGLLRSRITPAPEVET